MRKILGLFAVLALLSACEEKTEETAAGGKSESVEIQPEFDIVYDDVWHKYKTSDALAPCPEKDEAICAVDLTIKCTLDADMEKCEQAKMPKFIFMKDEGLDRPTEMAYKVGNVKPINENTVEVYTIGECNGNWFGLCSGNIIYVLSNKSGAWVVRDIYAIENM